MNIQIKQLSSADKGLFPEGLLILNRTQGIGMFKPDYLDNLVSNPDCFVSAAVYEEKIIAIAVAQLLSDFEYYENFKPGISVELKKKKVGSFSTLCVHEKFQAQGLGQKLSHERINWLRSRNCQTVLGVSWVSGSPNNSSRVFEKVGFKKINELANFFVESSLKNPFICPTCGNPPCRCSAILYSLELE